MNKTASRSPAKNFAYTLLHWFFVVVLSMLSFVLQYSFLTDTGKTSSGGLLFKRIYRVNPVMFFIGVALFFVGFCIIWKKYLAVDWNGFKEKCCMWKVAYVTIAIIALGAIFLAGIIIMFLCLGFDVLRPEWTQYGCFAFPIYVVLVIVIDFLAKRQKRRLLSLQENGMM